MQSLEFAHHLAATHTVNLSFSRDVLDCAEEFYIFLVYLLLMFLRLVFDPLHRDLMDGSQCACMRACVRACVRAYVARARSTNQLERGHVNSLVCARGEVRHQAGEHALEGYIWLGKPSNF